MSLSLTILGCGSSGGVPRPAMGWGACDPSNPRNRRRRCSIMLERRSGDKKTVVIIDTGPDFREQLLSANVERIDAVLYTHDHADHTHGIDDVRPVVIHMRQIVPIYATEPTAVILKTRFSYCFETPPGMDYPPIVRHCPLSVGVIATLEGPGGSIRATPFDVLHGDINALGFRIGNVAYSPDLHDIPDRSLAALEHLDVWIIDALRYTRHPSHLSVSEALAWIDRVKPKRAVLTNLHTDLDYETLKAQLPPHVIPAYDGYAFPVDGHD